MDSEEPTAWEEINPSAALAVRHEPRLPSSGLSRATPTEFRNELTACLALVAPTGMTEDDRQEWLRVAWGTLGHLPADLLALGCRKARESCDHPSKVVPTILAAASPMLDRRREHARPMPTERQIEVQPEPLTADQRAELNVLMKRFGIKTRYFDDGTVRELAEGEPDIVETQ